MGCQIQSRNCLGLGSVEHVFIYDAQDTEGTSSQNIISLVCFSYSGWIIVFPATAG